MPKARPTKPLKSFNVLFYVQADGLTKFTQISEVNSVDPKTDRETEDSSYVDYEEQITYTKSVKQTIEIETDVYEDSEFAAFILKNEGKSDIPVTVVRTVKLSSKTMATQAPYLMSVSSLSLEAGANAKLTSTFVKNGETKTGTFDAALGKFTEGAA